MIESGFLERVRHVTAQASGLLDKISNLPRVFNATQLKTITTHSLQLQALRDDAHKMLAPRTQAQSTNWTPIYTGYACSVCMHQLFTTPGGDCCVNGHGGADPLESKHYPDIEGQPVRAGDQYAPAHVGLDSITCDGHKYTFVEERTGGFRIDRHGEEWVSRRDLLDVPGSNAFTALFFEAVNLKRRNSDLECELEILRKRRG